MSSALAATTVKVVDDSSGPMEIVDALLDGPRRSLRKRGETTSYAESPDMMIIEEDGSARSAGGNSGNGSGGGGDIRPPPSKKHPQANGAVSEEDPERRTRCKDLRQRMEKIAPPGKTQEEEEEEESDDDDDDTIQEIPLPKDVPPSLLAEREATIKKLQTRLRNEEMSLVLLKKIQQSQVLAAAAVSAAASSSAAAAASKAINPAAVANNSNSSHGHGTPSTGAGKQQPSISYIGGGATITPATSSKATSKQHHHQPHHRSHQHPNHNLEPKTQISTDIQQLKSMDNKGQLPGSLPPNLINLMTNSGLSAKPKSKPEVNETPQQRQAAAKLALRKQLEKTLLQIPPPKPPPPEMHFIPNPTNSEFICLLGLEECVSKILMGNKENNATSSLTQPSHHHQLLPFSCSQCNTDFTPTWKWDKAAKGKEVKVICENCVTTNVKKALKAEHTNRLKSAFVKALQQEQELEAHMAQEASLAAAAAATAAAAASTSSSVTLSRSPRVSSPAASESTRRGLTVSPSTTRSPRGGGGGAAFSSSFCAPPPPAVSITQQSSSSSGRPSRGRGRPESNRNNHVGAKNNSLPNNTNSSNNAANALGYDLASMSALQAAATQQLLLAGGNGRGGNHPGSSSASSSSAGRGDTHQMTTAALGQHLMNPLLYNYQALALQAAMQAAAMGNNNANSNASNNINSSGGRYNSAANQMLELQQQIQRQYLLDMIPPGSLAQSWGGGSAKK
eukprot:TRINITY_DN2666_c0_g1_i1.p1 TRINITY_DN2666_c0_g1~~TRINITY_DN2666_c0_g1_i1.p1  ORF type:complete len:734 (+),score=318.49 TRINITY_DN2666_c0_g1_i1:261-2462(+)